MANMLDYIDWRGDITIHQSGINDVDCLIMAQISYMILMVLWGMNLQHLLVRPL